MHIYLRYIFILYCMYCQTTMLPQRSDFGTYYTYIRKKMRIYLRYIFISILKLKYLLDSLADRLVPGLPPISSQDDLWIVPEALNPFTFVWKISKYQYIQKYILG